MDKSSFNVFSTHLNVSNSSLAVMLSVLDLQSLYLPLCRPSARLSVRFDTELAMNLTQSVKLNL